MSELKHQLMLNEKMWWVPCYPKFEVDKVIAEKDNRCSKCRIEINKVIARQKYKRCLAMAMWCSAELGMLVSTWKSKIKHYKKWHMRWLELAEQYKEKI